MSEKNGKFAGESIESLRQWQEFEINNLREECHRRNKDFYVVSDNEEEQNKFFDFLSLLREGFSSYDLATDICNQIMEQFNKQDILYIVDGDKTIIIQDSYRFCCNGKTKIFDGDFYTGYQSFLFEKELQTASIDKSKIAEITINNEVYDIVASNNYVVLSSGIKDLWSDIANAKNLGTIFASPYISADVAERNKEFVVAAKALGVKEKNIIFRHIVPNVMTIIIVQATISFATCMLTESGLSFLGFGVAEPIPSWGNMLNNCRSSEVISQYWWRWVFPSVVLGLCTVSINLFGDGLRRAVDPKANER